MHPHATEQRAIGPFARLGGLPASQLSAARNLHLPGLSGLPGLRPQPQPQLHPQSQSFLSADNVQQYDESPLIRQQQQQQQHLLQQQMLQQQKQFAPRDSYGDAAYAAPPGQAYGGEERASGGDGSGFNRAIPVGRMQRLGQSAPVAFDAAAEYWPSQDGHAGAGGGSSRLGLGAGVRDVLAGGMFQQSAHESVLQFQQQPTQQFQDSFAGQPHQQQYPQQQPHQHSFVAEDFQGQAQFGSAAALLQSQLQRPLVHAQQVAPQVFLQPQQQQQQQPHQREQQFAQHGDAHFNERSGGPVLPERRAPRASSGGSSAAGVGWQDRGGSGGFGGDDRARRQVDAGRSGPPAALGGGRGPGGGARGGGDDRRYDSRQGGGAPRGADDARPSHHDRDVPDRDRRRDGDAGGGRDRPPAFERRERDGDAGGARRVDARAPVSRSSSQAVSLESGGSGRAPASRGRVLPASGDAGRADRLFDGEAAAAPYEPEPALGIPRLSLADALRCHADLAVRYPRLFVPEDFTHALATWVHTLGGGRRTRGEAICINLGPHAPPVSSLLPEHGSPLGALAPAPLADLPVIAVPDRPQVLLSEPAPPPAARGTPLAEPGCIPVQYTVRVALLTDASAVRGLPPDPADRQHRLSQMKCLVVSPAGSRPMHLPGAAWSRDADGGDPSVEDACLVRTAVRAVAAQAGLDLSACRRWAKVLELHYHRAAEEVDGAPLPEQVELCVVLTCLDAVTAARAYSTDESGRWVAKAQDGAEAVASEDGAENAPPAPARAAAIDQGPGREAMADAGEGVDGAPSVEPTSAARAGATTTQLEQLRSRLLGLRYEDLRAECRAAGLDVKGRKEALLQRLLDAAHGGGGEPGSDEVDASGDEAEADAEPGDPPPPASSVSTDLSAAVESAVAGVQAVETAAATTPSDPLKLEGLEPAASGDASGGGLPAAGNEVQPYAFPAPPAGACLVAVSPLSQPPPALGEAASGSGLPQLKLVSLRRLLQYNETDRSERLFELSLFAEAVAECLARDAARVFASALAGLIRQRPGRPRGEARSATSPATPSRDLSGADNDLSGPRSGLKRPREGAGVTAATGADVVGDVVGSTENPRPVDAEHPDTATSGTTDADCSAAAEKAGSACLVAASSASASTPAAPAVSRDGALRGACAFLDRAGVGFLEARDLEALLGRVGLGLSRGAARRLVAQAALDPGFRARSRCRFADVIEAVEAAAGV